jgi:RNA polymerase sigma factor (sigma-70 family)
VGTARGREERFQQLLQEHGKILYKVARSYSGSPDDTDDLIQEMVVQLWRSFERYDPGQRFSTWMYRIALNVAISSLRSATRRRRHLTPAWEDALHVAAPQPDPRVEELYEAIHRLAELDRALVILHLDGNPHEAIGEILGISTSNVSTRLGRIKQQLKRDFAHSN